MTITICSLGEGTKECLTLGTFELLKHTTKPIVLQSAQVEVASFLKENNISFSTLDDFYKDSPNFEELNQKCADYLQSLNAPLLCVIGEPYLNTLVAYLMKNEVEMEFVGNSISRAILKSGIFPETGISILPASAMETLYDFTTTVCITEIHSSFTASEIKLKLSPLLGDEFPTVLYTQDKVAHLPLYQIDGQDHYDHLTTLLLPYQPLLKKQQYTYSDLLTIVAILRGENGCPWDREQTHESIRKCLVEECDEVLEAMESEDEEHFCEELGDLLLQVALHGQIAADCGTFEHADITTAICKKLIRRHPHVFENAKANSSEDVKILWEEIKKQEKQR